MPNPRSEVNGCKVLERSKDFVWLLCHCGLRFVASRTAVSNQSVKSCGCLIQEKHQAALLRQKERYAKIKERREQKKAQGQAMWDAHRRKLAEKS